MTQEKDLAQRRRGAESTSSTVEPTLNELTKLIVDAGLEIHKELGPGLLETVYETVLARELTLRGLHVLRQVSLPVTWKGEALENSFRADLIVEGRVIVELKSVEQIAAVHKKQVLTYLKLTGMKVGLLLNFGTELFRDGIHRLANGIED
jgi:GxxExxY protein